jgi:hypothetical protein
MIEEWKKIVSHNRILHTWSAGLEGLQFAPSINLTMSKTPVDENVSTNCCENNFVIRLSRSLGENLKRFGFK